MPFPSDLDIAQAATIAPLSDIAGQLGIGDEFLEPLGLSVYELAKDIHVPRSRANDIVRGDRAITTDTALRLARYFGTTPEFWINLQARHDLDVADRGLRKKIDKEIKPRAA